MASKKTTARKTGGGGKINKSAFIRDLPEDMPAKDVVEKAKTAGLNMSIPYVYSIRTAQKARAKKIAAGHPPARRGRRPNSVVAATASSAPSRAATASSGHGKIEDLLRAVASELGLSNAIRLLQAEQLKVRAFMGG